MHRQRELRCYLLKKIIAVSVAFLMALSIYFSSSLGSRGKLCVNSDTNKIHCFVSRMSIFPQIKLSIVVSKMHSNEAILFFL